MRQPEAVLQCTYSRHLQHCATHTKNIISQSLNNNYAFPLQSSGSSPYADSQLHCYKSLHCYCPHLCPLLELQILLSIQPVLSQWAQTGREPCTAFHDCTTTQSIMGIAVHPLPQCPVLYAGKDYNSLPGPGPLSLLFPRDTV